MGRHFLYWECFDTLGNQICKEGTGKFIDHIESQGYPDITFEGQVVKGYAEGEWKGGTTTMFNYKFSAQYKRGKLMSAVGYDEHGNKYPFSEELVPASYKTNPIQFIDAVRRNIKLPRDNIGMKISIDDLHLRFVVEKDGHISNPTIIETKDTVLQTSVFTALKKCDFWNPGKILGIPVRTEIVIPLIEVTAESPSSHIRRLYRLQYLDRVLNQ